ncbi:MAG: VOC family protein [Chlorobi bacterium]|nr:VOC family protein [Chlorobiota bacterium]
MIKKIDHINISVTDIEKTKSFFTKLLDFKVEKEGYLEGDWMDRTVGLENVKAKFVKLTIPGTETSIELIQYFRPEGGKDALMNKANRIGFRHIAFEVKDIESIHRKFKDAGVQVFSEIQRYNVTKKLFYFYGPDDIILELAEYEDT